MTGYIFALKFIFLMALVGGELFRGSGEQGGLSTARRAADCRSLVRCLLSSFLLSTSLPACPACVHGLRLTKWPEMTAETIQMHTYTSYLHISCSRYAYLHKTSYLTAQNDTYCMFILWHVVAWFSTESFYRYEAFGIEQWSNAFTLWTL